MFGKIYRFFRRILGMTQIPLAPNLNARMRKFRFIVTNNGENGNMSMNEQPQVAMAPSPQYLVNLYAASGDRIRILEELPPDGETKSYGKINVADMANAPQAVGWAAKGRLGAGQMMNADVPEEQLKALEAMHGNNPKPPAPASSPESPNPPPVTVASVQPTPVPVSAQPTFFKIGNVECKMENGKVYQKQWMRVNDNDMANYRLISDKNNKILPMTGKHLEVLKWAISEDDATA